MLSGIKSKPDKAEDGVARGQLCPAEPGFRKRRQRRREGGTAETNLGAQLECRSGEIGAGLMSSGGVAVVLEEPAEADSLARLL